jgi:hypothetical protein
MVMARDLALERAWRERVARQNESGLTVQQFCEQEKLPVHQFSWWKSELKRRAAPTVRVKRRRGAKRSVPRKRRAVTTGFVPVRVTPNLNCSAPIEIVLDQPLRIAVSSGFDHELLTEVVRVLENRGC